GRPGGDRAFAGSRAGVGGPREAGRGQARMTPRPFTIKVADDVLADLRARLERVRWPDEAPAAAWRYGTSVAYMKELVEYWRHRYDWRGDADGLNTPPPLPLPPRRRRRPLLPQPRARAPPLPAPAPPP